MTRPKSSAGRLIVKLVFIGVISYMAVTVLGGFLLAIYEGTPEPGQEPRALFNQCMRQLTVLEDEFESRMVQAQLNLAEGRVDPTWPRWLDSDLAPTLGALRAACVLDTHPELLAVVDSLESRGKQAASQHASLSTDGQSSISDLEALGRRAP